MSADSRNFQLANTCVVAVGVGAVVAWSRNLAVSVHSLNYFETSCLTLWGWG